MNPLTPRDSDKGKSGVLLAVLVAGIVIAFVALGMKVRNSDARAAELGRQLAQATTESSEQKTELNQAKNQAADLADLRSQLATAISQKSELQTRLDQAAAQKAELLALQSRLETAARKESDLRSQLEQAKRQLAEIPPAQPKVEVAEFRATDRSSPVGTGKAQSADTQGQPTNAQPAPEKTATDVAAARTAIPRPVNMPIKTTWGRTPLWTLDRSTGKGIYVLNIISLWPDPLKIHIKVSRDDKTSLRSVTLAGTSTMTLVNLSVGDTIVIESDGYDPVQLTAG
jgi:multidrug efflux pump subunit AcrA (membrane-fusion protein)